MTIALCEQSEDRPYRTAAAHYRAGRPDYAPILIHRVVRFCGGERISRVLDLGCGPGLLAVAFAPYANEIVAMDPEPEMLTAVTAQEIPNVHVVRGSSVDLSSSLGSFRLVVMGRSFHRMDRAETLRRLDALVEPGGAVVNFDAPHCALPENGWTSEFRALERRYLAEDDSPHRQPGWVRHEGILLDSPFCHLEVVSVIEQRRVTVHSLVHRGLSMAGTTPRQLGTRIDTFVHDIERLMEPYATDGFVTEVIESQALVAFRRGEAPQ